VECHREVYADSSIGGDKPGFFFDKYLAKIGVSQIWVAEVAGLVVGFFGLEIKNEEAELEPIVVSKDWRRHGMGRMLVEKALDEAGGKVKYINVMPVARNADAVQFFYEMGFKNIGQIQLFINLSEKWNPKLKVKLHDCEFSY
jgi:N-acetylglutamate synthase-like GNAT family acetyltransferase